MLLVASGGDRIYLVANNEYADSNCRMSIRYGVEGKDLKRMVLQNQLNDNDTKESVTKVIYILL